MEGGTDSLIDRVNNTFDGFERLVKVERISAGVRSISEYLYNGDNLRVSKSVKKSSDGYKEEVTNYLYDRQNVILETDAKDKVKTRYVKGINYIASLSTSNKISYFLFNGHGDVVQTVDKTGEVLNHYDYDIWGNPILTLEIEESAIRYAGEFYDSETGLYYLRARYYDPYIGRFVSEDSYWGEDNNPLSLNRYTYAHNDPIQYLDPTGYAVIKKGASGDKVAAIQEMLNGLGYNTGKPDGKFGSKTDTALRKFQKDHDLKPDGIIGNQTLTGLMTMSSVKDASDNVKASAKDSISKAKTGDIKSDTILMSSKEKEKVYDNINTLKKESNGGSVKTEIQNNTIVITGVTVNKANSKTAEVKEKAAQSNSTTQASTPTVSSNNSKKNQVSTEVKGTGKEKWTITQPILDIADYLANNWLESITFGKVGTDELGALALDMYKEKGVYHARTSAWQQIGGYNEIYDMIFDIGTSMETEKFEFTDEDGRDYILWAWKGDYINLGAGAELGIYSRDSGFLGAADVSTPHDDHWLVDTSLALPMTMTLKEGNTVIANYTPSENQWWITSFNPDYKNRKASQLSVTYTVDFTGNEAMYNAFLKSDDYLRNKSMWSFLSKDNKYQMQLEF